MEYVQPISDCTTFSLKYFLIGLSPSEKGVAGDHLPPPLCMKK